MMKSSVYKALDKINELEKLANKYYDKAWEKYEQGNEKSSDHYEQKGDRTVAVITGMTDTLRILGLGVWRSPEGEWSIPMDDIERVC